LIVFLFYNPITKHLRLSLLLITLDGKLLQLVGKMIMSSIRKELKGTSRLKKV